MIIVLFSVSYSTSKHTFIFLVLCESIKPSVRRRYLSNFTLKFELSKIGKHISYEVRNSEHGALAIRQSGEGLFEYGGYG